MKFTWISFNKVMLVKALFSKPNTCLDIGCTNLQKIITVSPADFLLVNVIKSQKVAGCFSRVENKAWNLGCFLFPEDILRRNYDKGWGRYPNRANMENGRFQGPHKTPRSASIWLTSDLRLLPSQWIKAVVFPFLAAWHCLYPSFSSLWQGRNFTIP